MSKQPSKRMVIDSNDAFIVKSAFDLFLAKRKIAAVREHLKSVTPRKWTTDQARKLLRNEAYIGVLVFGKWRNDNAHEPILDNDTWRRAQEILDSQKSSRTRSARTKSYTYYLRSKVRCPHCGCNYTNSLANGRGGTVRYYECNNAKKHFTKCALTRINANALHEAVLNAIARATNHWTVMHKIIAESGGWQRADTYKKALRGQLGKQKQFLGVQVENILRAIEDGKGSTYLYDRLEQREQDLNDIV